MDDSPRYGHAPVMSIDAAEIDHRFSHHAPDAHRVGRHELVRAHVAMLAKQLVEIVPAGREQSLMVTALEEAMYWANAGIARA